MFDSIIKEVGSISRFSDLFCLLIVGIAVYTFIIFHIDTSKLYKNIKLLTNSIKGKNKMDINKILNFKKDKLISSQKLLSELWDKYCKAIENNRYYSDVSMYFNRTNIIEIPMKRKIAESIPGILTGLGILGTFIGLISGLPNINTSDSEQIKASISPLLAGLTTAFTTSVVGIFFSLLWTYFDRKNMKNRIKLLLDFVAVFRNSLSVKSDLDYMEKLIKLQEEQTETIKHLSTDIAQTLTDSIREEFAPAITSSIDDSLRDTFSPVLGELKETIKSFGEKATKSQNQAVQNIVNEFIQNMNKSLNGQFENLAETIKEMCEWQKQIKTDLSELIEEIKESTLNQNLINANAEEVIKNITDHITELYDATEILVDNLESIKELNKVVTLKTRENYELVSKIETEREEINSKYTEISKLVYEQVATIKNTWDDTRDGLSQINIQLTSSMKEFTQNTNDGLVRTFDIFDEH
jgi:hypothetical protein